MRALAVGAVVVFHAFPHTLPGGFVGVDVFFVISGFLISGMIQAGVRSGRFSLLEFYQRRIRRILPAFLIMLCVSSLLAGLVLMPDELERFASNVTAGSLFVPNLVLAREQGYFEPAAHNNPLLHLWSLGVEEQFYVVWPLLLMLIGPRISARTTVIVIVGFILLSLALNIGWARHSPNAAFYLPFTRVWQLAVGALLAGIFVARAEKGVTGAAATAAFARWPWMNDLMSLGGLGLIGLVILFGNSADPQVSVSLPVTIGAALFIAAGPQALPNRVLFSWRPVVYVGLISYPLYLWHWPPLSFLNVMGVDAGTTGLLWRIGAVVFATIAAMLTYHLVEVPIRKRTDMRRLCTRLLAGLGTAAAAGVAVAATGGLPQRTSLDHNPFYRTEKMDREDWCSKRYDQPEALYDRAYCVRNDAGRDPEIVVMGDSYSNVFVGAMYSLYPDVSTLQIGGRGCPYLRQVNFWNDHRSSWRESCPPLVEAAYRSIGPSTRLVILLARMPMYTASDAEYAATIDYVSPKYFQSPEFPGVAPDEIFRRSLARDLRVLLADDREVVVFVPYPPMKVSPRTCLRFRPIERWMAAPAPDVCTVPRSEIDAVLARSRGILADVAKEIADPDLHVVDPADALCDAQVCRAVIDGRLMYLDDNHLSPDGAKYVWSHVSPRNLRATTGRHGPAVGSAAPSAR